MNTLLRVRMMAPAALAACVALLVAGCANLPAGASGSSGGGASAPASPGGTGIAALERGALPPGAVFKAESSLVFGTGDQWVGRIAADVGRDLDAVYRYFAEQYPVQGWTLISAVRGKTSLLVFTRQDRTATVELSEGNALTGGSVVVTVSPRSSNQSVPVGGGNAAPRPAAAPAAGAGPVVTPVR